MQLRPIFDDWDYLEDQHLLLAVKTTDDMESYGNLKTLLYVDGLYDKNLSLFCYSNPTHRAWFSGGSVS